MTKTKILLRLTTLLLLLVAGVGETWGQILYQQNYEAATDASSWTSANNSGGLSLQTGDATYGKYIRFYGNNAGGPRTASSLFYSSNDFYGNHADYTIEFDATLKTTGDYDSETELVIASDGYSLSGNQHFTYANTGNRNYLFLLKSKAEKNTTTYYLNGGSTEYTIADNTWFHVKLDVNIPNKQIGYTITGAVSANGTITVGDNSSMKAKAIIATVGRGTGGTVQVDNIKIYHIGWSATEHTVNLTDVNYDNKITSGMPTLYNPNNESVTYSYSGTALGTYDLTYPPRLKSTGNGTVTATFGGKNYSYTLHVNGTTVSGTYTASNNRYSFDQTGIITQRSFTDVDGVTMTINGGPTAVVVNTTEDNVMYKTLKVIDNNGFSHPNRGDNNAIPYEGNWGGTFYKFEPTEDGHLYFEGHFKAANWVKDGTVLSTGTTKDFDVVAGSTYYLYNTNPNNTPLLHSYRFVPLSKGTLKFVNPGPTIIVDMSEGSYTNVAVSGLGLPVTYSIVSGSSYATINSATGKVTFKESELLNETFPLTITVAASTGAWPPYYPAETVNYTIQLAKTTWIFNDNDLWTTMGSDLTSNWSGLSTYTGNYRDGTQYYGVTKILNGEKLTKDGTNELLETKGLRFTTDASSSRLGIAPKNVSPNYLSVVNTTIFIDNVQEGQTVTVDWYATRSQARMSITDANGETTGDQAQGVVALTATTTGTVQLTFGSYASYIRSIKISTPVRATGTLTYSKLLLDPNETVNRIGYTITDEETGDNIKDAYHGPGTFKSSNTDVVTVDASGNITGVGIGVAFITATASPKNSTTHQTVTLTTMVEVVNPGVMSSASTHTRTISVDKLLYDVGENGKNAKNKGLDRTVPGFTLTFDGDDGAKCNNKERLTLRKKDADEGSMTLTTRPVEGKGAWIIKVKLTVANLQNNPQVTYVCLGNEITVDVTDGVLELGGIYYPTTTFTATQGSFDITDIKIYYGSDESTIDNCLDETKVAPTFNFPANKQHFMRVPGDGRAFQNDTPSSSDPKNFRASDFTYTSSNTSIATIGRDGTGGRLIGSGEATITATFAETDYFAESTATYTVSNTLLPGERYDGISMTDGQFIHVTAQASADGTVLTLENAAGNLTYGTERERQNTHVNGNASVNLVNSTQESITIYSTQIVTPNVKAWVYYEGQEENFSAQVQFTGFPTGPIIGFKVVDFGDINNPIDLTDAYEWRPNSQFALEDMPDHVLLNPDGTIATKWYSDTGEANTPEMGTTGGKAQIRRLLVKKTGMAEGYDPELRATSDVTVMSFGPNNKVVWRFQEQLDNTGASGQMGSQWTYTNPGTGREKFYGAAFMDGFMPILKNGNVVKDNNVGILVSGEMRYYCGTSGLRLNLTTVNAHMKFPVKQNMEVVVEVATSAADVTNHISNAKEVTVPYNDTDILYVLHEGVNSPINAYFLAKNDGSMTFDAGDKVGVYIKSITLQVPELHFTEEIVTEQTGDASRTVNYKPYNAIEGHTLNYWVKDGHNHDLNDGWLNTGDVATITDGSATEPGHSGDVTLTNNEGWVTIYVEDPEATGVQPKKGEYKLYVVNFHFANPTYNITLDGTNGEAYFTERPVGYDKVKTPIEYSMTLGAGNPRGRLIQYTNENPALTTYTMAAYSSGTITVTATSGHATTSCVVEVGGLSFQQVAPSVSDEELKGASPQGSFVNALPAGWSGASTTITSVSCTGEGVSCTAAIEGDAVKLTNIKGHGAIRVIAQNGGQTARFVLTVAYPASSRKKWAFFRAKDTNGDLGLQFWANVDNAELNSYAGYNNAKQNVTETIQGTEGWTTESTWTEIFRKGAELPRWGNDRSMKGDNAFYVQETAGLQIETGNRGFYIDLPARDANNKYAYNHIGLHNNASITVPKMRNGEYVSLNLSRVIPNNGAILRGHNVTDLRGKAVTEEFTISRSQTEWSGLNDDGTRFIPGYYTFVANDQRAANDPDKIAHPDEFDVTFELADEGYLDVLSVEIYDGGRYKHTMTDIKLKDQNVAAPNFILKEENDTEDLRLEFCHPLWSTSTGPCEYVFKGEQVDKSETYTPTEARYWVDAATTQKLKDDRKNLNLKLDYIRWLSARGVEYEDGLLTAMEGYGKVVLRMNNYTVEGRYLIGYTPDYVLNVGIIPHQVYPHTWNFTNISCGEVQGQEDNVYNSISNDGGNWINIEKDIYELNTDYHGASLYVPGSELVSIARILGQKGEHGNTDRGETPGSFTPTQTSTPRGYDELNGLGVSGKIIIPASPVAASVRKRAKTQKRAPTNHILLTYSIESTNISANTNLQAGEGTIHFGSSGKFEESSISSTHYTYRCDGGDTKYVLLKPKRAFRAGDIISIKGYSQNENGGLAFWTARTSTTGTKKLVSLPVSQTNVEETLEYVVTVNDGIENLTELYVYNSGTTSFFNSVTITESYMPEDMDYTLYTVTATTLTIPDLNADGKQDWIYISADAAPTTVTNATAVTENNDPDGPDANSSNKVYKYKVTDPGAAYVTFPANTNVYQIGVTDILKDIHEVGGVGWATESRRHSIDHTLTGFFTVNDANAYTVSYDSYDLNTATVALSRVEDGKGVPAKAGVVLRVDQATNLSQANLNTSNNLRSVPLFYPAVSTSIIPYEDMRFKSNGNMMMANLELRNMTHEQENGTLDDNEDAVDDTGAEDSDFTRFMLTNIHWTYNSSHTLNDDEAAGAQNADAAGFYRLHIWETTNDKDEKNQLAANTAYMLVPTTQLPIAVWKNQPKNSAVRQNTIAIRDGNISETNDIDVIYTYDGIADDSVYENDAWYTLDGKKLNGQPTKSGLYIHNGRKVVK